jgi:hypothetical protein
MSSTCKPKIQPMGKIREWILRMRWAWIKHHFGPHCKCYACRWCDWIHLPDYGIHYDEVGCYYEPSAPFVYCYNKGCPNFETDPYNNRSGK